jgi:hypothetical protein
VVERGLRHGEGSGEVLAQHRAERVRRHVRRGRLERAPCVVDQSIQPAEPPSGLVHERLGFLGVACVAADSDHRRARGDQAVVDRLQPLLIAAVHGDSGAAPGEVLGHALAQTAGRARDQHAQTGDVEIVSRIHGDPRRIEPHADP